MIVAAASMRMARERENKWSTRVCPMQTGEAAVALCDRRRRGGRGRSHLVKLPAALIGRRKEGRRNRGVFLGSVCSFVVVTVAALDLEEPNTFKYTTDPIKLLHFVVLSPEKDSRLDLRPFPRAGNATHQQTLALLAVRTSLAHNCVRVSCLLLLLLLLINGVAGCLSPLPLHAQRKA